MAFKSYPRVYFELLFIGFTIVLGMGLSQSFLPIFAEDLDPGSTLAGFVVSAWFFSRIFMELPSGVISDRIGRARLLIIGIGLSSFGALLCALSNSIYTLILGRGIWGLGTALYFMNNSALILDLFDSNIRGRALGTFQSIEFIGSFIGAPIGAFMAESIGRLESFPIHNYNMVFFIATIAIFASFLLAFFSKKIRQVGVKKSATSSVSIKDVLLTLGNLSVAIICINTFSRMLIMGGINQTILEIYLEEEAKISIGLIGIILGIRTAGHIMSTFAAGYLSDKIGRRPIIIAGMLIESISFYIYANAPSFEIFALTGLIAGIGEGMVFACLLVLLSEIVPPHMRGGAIGLYRTFMDLGGFFGPILFVFLYDYIGVTSPFYCALIILLLNATLVAAKRNVKPV